MRYYSDVTGVVYETIEELQAEELRIKMEEEEKKEREDIAEICHNDRNLIDLYKLCKECGVMAAAGDSNGALMLRFFDGTKKKYKSVPEALWDLTQIKEDKDATRYDNEYYEDDDEYYEDEEEDIYYY